MMIARLALVVCVLSAGSAAAQSFGSPPVIRETVPPAVAATGVDERLGAQVPLDPPFTAAGHGRVTLRDLLDGKQPVLLVLAYARCTMLCSLVLRGVTDVARRMPLVPGRDYRLVLVTLDPRETLEEATKTQVALLGELGRGAEPARWPYLIGERSSIDAVANALGFRYAWDASTEQYAHAAVIFALTPDGRVSRYLHGVQFDPEEVSGALDDARAGRIVSAQAAEVLRCFRFDPATRRAAQRVQRLLQIGSALVFLFLLAAITTLIVWERRRRP
jgi:protein SCO1/2